MTFAVIKAASDYYGIPTDAILGRGRYSEVLRARFSIYYVLRERDGMSTPQIGKRLNRDHSTVLSGLRRVLQVMRKDAEVADFIAAQMALPRFSRTTPPLFNFHHQEPDPTPPLLRTVGKTVPLRTPEPKEWERVEVSNCHDFMIDEDGLTVSDHIDRRKMVRGSRDLAKAILRELAA